MHKNNEPSKRTDNNADFAPSSKSPVVCKPKSNANYQSTESLALDDLIQKQPLESNYGEIIRLAYISSNNQIQIDEQALFMLQRYSSSQIGFVGIYGRKGSGKSLLFDKIINLAGVQGSHYCRTSQNYAKGLYFYSIPFIKNMNIRVFLLDCVGFELSLQPQTARQDDMLLDLMMILSSSVIILPSPEDFEGQIFSTIYDRISKCTQRITQNKINTTPAKQYWPKNVYCLLRNKQVINKKHEQLQKLFLNYNCDFIYDALPQNHRLSGVNKQQLVQIEAIPGNNPDNRHIDGLYVKQASRLVRQIMHKMYNKKYHDLNYNGNTCCKLLLTLIKHLNNKQRIRIDRVFESMLKELYDSAYQYHIQFYDQKLQDYFMEDEAFPLDYLLMAFQDCRYSSMASFNQLSINEAMHIQYQGMLEKHISDKQELILQINKKKTNFHLKNKLKQSIKPPQNLKDQILQFILTLKSLQKHLDHDRCQVFSSTLLYFAGDLQKKQLQEALRREHAIAQDLARTIQIREALLDKNKEIYMKGIMLNTQNRNKYQALLKQSDSLDYKIKNTQKEIEIQKKFHKQSVANKQVAKEHAQSLLAYIRELQQKSRDNQKNIDQIKKQFQYNPTIQILQKRIEQKIRQQKQIDKGESLISQKQFRRRTQVRNIITGSNISGVKAQSTVK